MEMRAGVSRRTSRDAVDALTRAYRAAGRLMVPSSEVFERAGAVLRKLKLAGRKRPRRLRCANDVLIASDRPIHWRHGGDRQRVRLRCYPAG